MHFCIAKTNQNKKKSNSKVPTFLLSNEIIKYLHNTGKKSKMKFKTAKSSQSIIIIEFLLISLV